MKLARIILALTVIVIGAAAIVLWPSSVARILVVGLVMLYLIREIGPRLVRKPVTVSPASSAPTVAGLGIPPASAGRPIAEVESFLEDLVARGFSPRGILDVGANRGDWTRMALERFPRAQALLIEPQTEMEPRLEALVEENPNCAYLIAGVGREPGQLVQTIWEDTYGSSFCVPADPVLIESGRQRITPIETLDSILATRHPDFEPDLVKLDIQGFELEALRGGASLFGRTRIFIVETLLLSNNPQWPALREVVDFMGERGYEIYDITSFLRKPSDGTLGQIDFAFVQKDGEFRQNFDW